MSSPLGEEFIKIRPDASTFRAELQAQIAAAMTGVQGQIAQAQRQLTQTATAGTTTPSGLIIPPGVRSVTTQTTAATNAQTTATKNLGNASKATNQQLQSLATTSRKNVAVTQDLRHGLTNAETAAGRYTRGMVAATAASTGFFRAVSFASGAFLIGATVGATIGAAVKEFQNMTVVAAQTAQIIRSTGGSANVTAGQVDTLAKAVLRVTGIDDELVKQSANVLLTFRAIRNEAGAGNDVFNRAVKATADIATVFRVDLRGAALQLGKALQDPERGVTALRRSGITLSVGQRELIKQLVQSGAVLTAQKVILGEVERQVGSTAEAIGKTLPGRLRIMREEALNSLGELVKQLSESKTAADLAAGASQGIAQAFGAVKATLKAIGPSLVGIAQGFNKVSRALGVGSILGAVAAYGALKLAIGSLTRLQALYVAASAGAARAELAKAVAAGTATGAFRAEAAAEVTAARSAQAAFSTMTALAGVFALGAAASGQWTLALISGGIAVLGMAAKARAAVTALRAAGAATGAMAIAMEALGGPIGVAALGVGVLAAGLLILRRNSDLASTSLAHTKGILDQLNKSVERSNQLRAAVGTARERVGVAGFDVRAADRDVARARAALTGTTAPPGSEAFLVLQEKLRVAQDERAKATKRLSQAQLALAIASSDARNNEQQQVQTLTDLTSGLRKTITETARLSHPEAASRVVELTRALVNQGLTYDQARAKARALVQTELVAAGQSTKAVDQVISRYQKLADSETGAGRQAARAILLITETFRRLPTTKELNIIIRLASQGRSVAGIIQDLLPATATVLRIGLPTNLFAAQSAAAQKLNANLLEQARIDEGNLKTQQKKLKTLRDQAAIRNEALRSARLEVAAARDAVTSARESRGAAIEGLADARRGLAQAQQSLKDAIFDTNRAVADARKNLVDTIKQTGDAVKTAIQQAKDATKQAVQDAKGNLLDLNQSIADSIAQFQEKVAQGADKLSPRLLALRQQILQGGGGPLLIRAAQQAQTSLQAQAPAVDADKIKRQFTDLTDAFVRGRINLQTYDKRFNQFTRGLNIAKFRDLFGNAAANELIDTLKAARTQAILVARSPKEIGGAVAQKLVNPLRIVADGAKAIAQARLQSARDIAASRRSLGDALREQKRTISQAQQGVADAVRAVAKAQTAIVAADRELAATERRLRQAQHKETIANTAAVRANAKETKQLRLVIAARRALIEPQPKPTGAKTTEANNLRAGFSAGFAAGLSR